MSFPKDERPDGVSLDDTVEKFGTPRFTPDKITLELRNLDRSIFDFRKQRCEGYGLRLWKGHGFFAPAIDLRILMRVSSWRFG
jgi:hypothetical protein